MSKEKSADLIMKLYDLRREGEMRKARNWFATFFPETADDIMTAMINPETSAYYRMVTSYWDMAASFVNQGAIDEDMFLASAGEGWIVFSKVQPFLSELREKMATPQMLGNLDELIMRQPDALTILESRREMMKRLIAASSEFARAAGH